MERKMRLGRGLDALLPGAEDGSSHSFATASLASIVPNPLQPRRHFDEDELASLAASICEQGVLQPIVVREANGKYQIIAGERRYRAALAVGLGEIPIRIMEMDDQQVLEAALAENIHRADLNPIEKAQGFQDHLKRFGLTHDLLAKRLGLARSTVTNLVALMDLPQEIRVALQTGQITTGHAKALKGVEPARQLALCNETIARGLSVHALEEQVRSKVTPEVATEPKAEGKPKADKTAHVRAIEEELRGALSVKVEIKLRGAEAGTLCLDFQNGDDFERLIDLLKGPAKPMRRAA
ncbi:MAG: ParB/RepB/Spo0J family partition protein [Planctomycetota bacterium]|nr:ParB/RepB/Spo0J family partition protein [Planctomycetota bacterium]RLT19169.1 MAG: ParB/RepB/Spo0J family partition protein [Planctomycetota bacterium]